MNIGEEEEAVEFPMPVVPGKENPIHEPSPQVAPVEEPAHARHLHFHTSEGKIEMMEITDNG
jgi:hypothetical protein